MGSYVAQRFAIDYPQRTQALVPAGSFTTPPAFLDLAVNESLKVPARVWRAAFAGLMQADHRALLGRIKAPTLIVWGEKETYFLCPNQDALTAAIKKSCSRHRAVAVYGFDHALQDRLACRRRLRSRHRLE